MGDIEVWRAVVGFEGFYEISSLGNVKSLERDVTDRNGVTRHVSERIMRIGAQKNGYLCVGLRKPGSCKTALVHRLVAEAFIPNPNGYDQINHIDEDKTNNKVGNLEWCTKKMNLNHGSYQTRKAVAQGKPIVILDHGVEIATFATEGVAAHLLGCSQGGISMALRGKAATYRGLEWRYAK